MSSAAPVPPPVRAARAPDPICYFGACYDYVYGRQQVDASGARVALYQARPELDPSDPDAHSLQELAVESADGAQIVEVGWTVDRGLSGDARPHLFVYHWVDGQESCYNGCGFVSTSSTVTAGMRLTVGATGTFAISYRDGGWSIAYDGVQFGYFPGSLWSGRFTRVGLVQAFGEVAADVVPSCTDMGDGQRGASRQSSFIDHFRLIGTTTAPSLQVFETSPQRYSSGYVHPASFHLGGPGSGRCPRT